MAGWVGDVGPSGSIRGGSEGSDGSSTVGDDDLCDDGDFNADIDDDYVTGIKIYIIKSCSMCRHQSNEVNPLKKGPHCKSVKWPCHPWARGSHQQPVGNMCFLCDYVWSLGGFANEYESRDECKKAMKLSSTLTGDHFL